MTFAGDETKEMEIPHEPGHVFTFRNLSGPELDEADIEGTRRLAARMRRMPKETIEAGLRDDTPHERDEVREYDWPTLLRYGVVAWRCPQGDAPCGSCRGLYRQACNDENKAKADTGTLEWAARTIFEMSTQTKGV